MRLLAGRRARRALEAARATTDPRAALGHFVDAVEQSTPGSSRWREAAFGAAYLLVGENAVRDVERAIPLLEALIAEADGYDPAYYYLGEALVMRGDFDRAEAIFRRALDLDPNQEGIGRVLGHLPVDRVHAAARSGGDMMAEVERVPAAHRTAEMWVLYGDALAAKGRPEEAGAAWRAARRLEPVKGLWRRFRSIGESGQEPSPP